MARKLPELEAPELLDLALRALASRAYSVAELREKLTRRAANEEDVAAVLDRLREYGYVNDRKLADAFASARLANQGLGKARVVRDLRKRRVARGVAESAAEEAYRGADEVALIEAFLRRKYRSEPLETLLADPRSLASVYRRLRSAGFTASNSIAVLRRFTREAEALEGLEESPEETA